MSEEIELVVLAAAAFLLAVFSGAFNALEVMSLTRHEKEEDDDGKVLFARQFMRDPVRFGVALSLARALCAGAVVVSALQFSKNQLFAGGAAGPFLTAALVVIALIVPVVAAKMVALRNPEGFVALTRPLTVPAAYLFGPLAVLALGVIRRLSPALLRVLSFPVMPLKDKIEAFGYQNGGEADEEQRIISSVMEFGETRVREVMVPRIDIVAIRSGVNREDAVNLIVEAGHSRIPIYEDTIDRVIGVIYTKDLLRRAISGEDFSLRDLARPAFFVPESKMIDELLTEFRSRRQHLAVVVDEYGGTAGIVTLEDVLEEIVGDIQDEFDTEEELIRRVNADSAVCNAKVRVDELNEALGIHVTEEVAESLGGLLYHMIGQIPRVGDTWSFDELVFKIQSIERQRIDKVLITGLVSPASGLEDSSG